VLACEAATPEEIKLYDDHEREEAQRYRAPVFTWTIEGVPVSGNGATVVNVIVDTRNPGR
jgi:hypothetical protein